MLLTGVMIDTNIHRVPFRSLALNVVQPEEVVSPRRQWVSINLGARLTTRPNSGSRFTLFDSGSTGQVQVIDTLNAALPVLAVDVQCAAAAGALDLGGCVWVVTVLIGVVACVGEQLAFYSVAAAEVHLVLRGLEGECAG